MHGQDQARSGPHGAARVRCPRTPRLKPWCFRCRSEPRRGSGPVSRRRRPWPPSACRRALSEPPGNAFAGLERTEAGSARPRARRCDISLGRRRIASAQPVPAAPVRSNCRGPRQCACWRADSNDKAGVTATAEIDGSRSQAPCRIPIGRPALPRTGSLQAPSSPLRRSVANASSARVAQTATDYH
jgi:hypothetical protein